MRGSAAFRTGVAPGGALAPGWVKNELWRKARTVPSLDLRFADNKSLVDATTGASLVTFTRASSGTFVGSDGVLRSAVTNLLLRSEEFDNASWGKTTATVIGNATIAPNGTLTADKLITDSGASGGRVSVSISLVIGSSTTLSCFAKQDETSLFGLFVSDGVTGRAVDFDLATGTISGAVSAGLVASIQPTGDGWYRCVATVTSPAGTSGSIRIRQAVTLNDGTSGLFIWGAQLEQSATAGEYIPTTSVINSAPRFDHNPTTGESLGLLVEESRTNIFRNNTMVGAVAGSPGTPPTNGWAIVNSATYTSSILGTGTENGINYIDIQYVVAAAAPAALLFYCDTPAASASTAYTGSYYLKLVSGTIPQVRFTWQDGISTYNRTLFTLTATLTRYTDTLTTAVSANLARFAVGIDTAPSGATFVIRVGLPQVEQGAFATSVIPTTTAAATRSADVASITGSNFSSWYNQTEGTVFANTSVPAVAPATSFQTQYAIHNGSADNRITVYKHASADTSTRLDISAATVRSAFINAGTFGLNNLTASAVQINNCAISLNGLAAVADTTVTVPSVNQISLGSYVGATNFLNGTIRRLCYFPTRLANNTLQSITQ